MINNISLALRLKNARVHLNLTQEYISELLNLTAKDIDDIENNERDISTIEFKTLCRIYGYTVNQMLSSKKQIHTKFHRDFLELSRRKKEIFLDILRKID